MIRAVSLATHAHDNQASQCSCDHAKIACKTRTASARHRTWMLVVWPLLIGCLHTLRAMSNRDIVSLTALDDMANQSNALLHDVTSTPLVAWTPDETARRMSVPPTKEYHTSTHETREAPVHNATRATPTTTQSAASSQSQQRAVAQRPHNASQVSRVKAHPSSPSTNTIPKPERVSNDTTTVFQPKTRPTKTVPTVSADRAPTGPRATLSPSHRKDIYWNGFDPLNQFAIKFFEDSNLFCQAIDQERSASNTTQPLAVHISFGCRELFYNSGYGTGNFISILYSLRLAALAYDDVTLHFTCHDADATQRDLILPWLTGHFAPRLPRTDAPLGLSVPQVCGDYHTSKIVHLHHDMRYDLRRMAIGLVGLPHDHAPSAAFARDHLSHDSRTHAHVPQLAVNVTRPVFAEGSVALDDAVVHFRCGDLMDSNHGNFAFLTFASYTSDISAEARSIGIITQPFQANNDNQQARWHDAGAKTQDRCRTVVLALVDYIQERHPQARVTIHNGPSETIALAYARMVMANQTIVGISTFGVFPVLATFGTGYLHQPRGPFVNGWMLHEPRIDHLVENVHWIEETNYIMVTDMKQLWETQGETGVLRWFRGDESVPNATEHSVTSQ